MRGELLNTKNELEIFAGNVVGKAKNNLKRKNKLASKNLYNSIDYKLKQDKTGLFLTFEAEDYWEFIDYGVKGVGGKKADGTEWKKKKVNNSRFKYKTKRPKTIYLNGWTIRKGIAPRDKSGKFMKRKSLLHAISTSIFHTGLETTSFYSKPIEEELKTLPEELIEAYSIDLDAFLKEKVL